ncbi:hypothetical protein [Photorhabdus sp. P32]|uniref:hypothetical protein n=1 Tax=Photorhabdus sp. P32 TaxID=3117549 RepID=UPI0040548B57
MAIPAYMWLQDDGGADIKDLSHLESDEIRYEKITWKYLDGNIIYFDSWKER